MKKRCTKCLKTKILAEFNFKDKAKGKRNTRCKECTRIDVQTSYRKNRKYYLMYRSARNKMLQFEASRHIYNYLCQHPCVDCGINDPAVLQFDHVRGEKKYVVSSMTSGRHAMSKIIAEIEKCEVRCANCHMRKTAREQGWYKRHRDEMPLKMNA